MNDQRHSQVRSTYSVKGVTFRYGSRGNLEQKAVLRDVSFSLEFGEILGVIGPNGSGKSTLLKLLARVMWAKQGTIQLFGEDLQRLSQSVIARSVALVPQETQQLFPFTIAQMVLMGRFPHHRGFGGWHWEDKEDLRIAEHAMRDLDVVHLGDRLITDVSGGERQRAIIARALTQQPRVLLLDEPTAFLDLHHQVDIVRILKRLNGELGLAVILISHDLNLASQYCDRLMLLQEGNVVRVGFPEEVIRPEIIESVYGCSVLVDRHPQSGMPRVSLPV